MKTYAILGATGNTGKPIALGLLAAGHKVRIVSRDAVKAKELTDKGAELFIGDAFDEAAITKAFTGADAAYAMLRMDYGTTDYDGDSKKIRTALINAVKASKVPNLVFLSSVGAHLESGAGVVQGLQLAETELSKIDGLNVLYLRPSFFMENLYGQVGAIQHMGFMSTPALGDVKLPMVHTKDIAEVGLKKLLDLDYKNGSIQYILGQRDVSYNEVAQILGSAIGKPDLKYVESSPEMALMGMTQMGMSESIASKMIELNLAFNDGRALTAHHRDNSNTTKTSIEEFAHSFKYAFENS